MPLKILIISLKTSRSKITWNRSRVLANAILLMPLHTECLLLLIGIVMDVYLSNTKEFDVIIKIAEDNSKFIQHILGSLNSSTKEIANLTKLYTNEYYIESSKEFLSIVNRKLI